jgi:type IV pilus biogenesis protein CpaD/CtpE
MKKVVVWALVAAALAAGSAACTAEEPSEAAGNKPAAHETEAPKSVKKALREEQKANPETQEITAENVVDVMYLQNPKAKKAFCENYAVTGYDAGFKAFARGYGKPAPGTPSAHEVYDEAVERC